MASAQASGVLIIADYRAFCHDDGHDITDWAGFTLLRDIRELRMACYVAQHSEAHGEAPLDGVIAIVSPLLRSGQAYHGKAGA